VVTLYIVDINNIIVIIIIILIIILIIIIHLSVSAVVNSPQKGKCGHLPQHFFLRLDAVAVIPCSVQF